jgi:hypothetical protein
MSYELKVSSCLMDMICPHCSTLRKRVSHFFFIGREDRVRGERGRRWLEGKRENERQTGKKTET